MKEISSYLCFDGNCREAMTFYEKCLGGELFVMPFSAMPNHPNPEHGDRVMHARLKKGATVVMASDTMPLMPFQQGNNYWMSLTCESVEEVDSLAAALGEKGKVSMPPQETFWAARFAMLTDQFGVQWMLNFEKPQPPKP